MIERAKSELARISRDETKFINDCTLKLIEYIVSLDMTENQMRVVLSYVERITRDAPLTPLTGEDDEWDWDKVKDVGEFTIVHNKRRYSVIKYVNMDKMCLDTEAAIKSLDGGLTWQSGKPKIVKFPYMPPFSPKKTYLELIRDDEDPECWYYEDITDMPNRITALYERELAKLKERHAND